MPRALALLLIAAACGPDGLPGPAPQSTKQAVSPEERATNFQIVQNGLTSVPT